MSRPFDTLLAVAAPLVRDNIDTDAIIPSREMTAVSKQGLGVGLFASWRYVAIGSRAPQPDFVLNQPAYAGAEILLGGENFGCGSSREHAAWAIADLGIRAILAPDFADIFAGNAFKNGILLVALPQAAIDRLLSVATHDEITVDLEHETVTTRSGDAFAFTVDPFRRHCLLNGLDEIALTLADAAALTRHEDWLAGNRRWRAHQAAQ